MEGIRGIVGVPGVFIEMTLTQRITRRSGWWLAARLIDNVTLNARY
jgi:hypothetical protein